MPSWQFRLMTNPVSASNTTILGFLSLQDSQAAVSCVVWYYLPMYECIHRLECFLIVYREIFQSVMGKETSQIESQTPISTTQGLCDLALCSPCSSSTEGRTIAAGTCQASLIFLASYLLTTREQSTSSRGVYDEKMNSLRLWLILVL